MSRKRVNPWNTLTMKQARFLQKQADSGDFDLGNLRGYVKHVIGMCSDEEPHQAIAKELWRMTDEITILQGYRWNESDQKMERRVAADRLRQTEQK